MAGTSLYVLRSYQRITAVDRFRQSGSERQILKKRISMSNRNGTILPLLAQWMIVALLTGSWPSASVADSATDRNVKKERQMLRRMQQQLNEMQQQKSALDQEKTALEETLRSEEHTSELQSRLH